VDALVAFRAATVALVGRETASEVAGLVVGTLMFEGGGPRAADMAVAGRFVPGPATLASFVVCGVRAVKARAVAGRRERLGVGVAAIREETPRVVVLRSGRTDEGRLGAAERGSAAGPAGFASRVVVDS
jgi:hypothetical protein